MAENNNNKNPKRAVIDAPLIRQTLAVAFIKEAQLIMHNFTVDLDPARRVQGAPPLNPEDFTKPADRLLELAAQIKNTLTSKSILVFYSATKDDC